jgi:Phytanoyl-CoA dioxygenase (PhyH)
LRADVLEELQRFSCTETCYAEEDFQIPFSFSEKAAAEQRYGRKLKVGRFDDVLQTNRAIQNLAADPTLLAIARDYLGAEPALLGSRMWWSFASEADAVQQRTLGQGFHYDLDGYRALAFFFYLTDVTLANGPHILVSGSHKQKPLKALVSLHKSRSDAEITAWYGEQRQMVLCGSAGEGFAEDIFCFHKGLHPKSGDRLILQLRFGLRNYDGDAFAPSSYK